MLKEVVFVLSMKYDCYMGENVYVIMFHKRINDWYNSFINETDYVIVSASDKNSCKLWLEKLNEEL